MYMKNMFLKNSPQTCSPRWKYTKQIGHRLFEVGVLELGVVFLGLPKGKPIDNGPGLSPP